MSIETSEFVSACGKSLYRIRTSQLAHGQQMRITICRDDQTTWAYDQPSWRPVGVGCAAAGAYVWAARAIIVLPSRDDADPDVLDIDEDVLFVIGVDAGWLAICETSVRLIVGHEETSRIEAGDVIEHARWAEGQLLIEDARRMLTRIRISGTQLSC